MPGRWIVKTEPSTYSFEQLEQDRRTAWDGVRNPQALIHLRAMAVGDEVLVYHSGDAKALVGVARVARGPYADPAAGDPRFVAVDLVPVRRLKRPVTLAELKASGRFPKLGLVRQGRLSVMPATPTEWSAMLRMAATTGP